MMQDKLRRWSMAGAIAAASFTALVSIAGCGEKSTTDQVESSPAVAEALADVIKSPNDTRAYRTLTLDNGLEVLLVSDPDVEKSAAALSVGVGLMFDPMDYQGMAHYLEHMLFLGTEKFPQPDEYMAYINENGGARNAYTWLDITNYMFEIKNDAYDGALDRFSHFFKTPLLDPEYIEKEKSAVNAEWSMRRELDFFGMFKLGRSMLGDHPANRFLIGNLESLADKPDSSLHQATVGFYEQYYSANIMKVAMVSDRSLDEMAALARTYFSDIANKQVDEPEVTAEVDFAQAAGKLIHYVPQEDQRLLQLDFIIESNMDQFRVKPNQYLAYIIGSEMPDTPAARLKELGWASSLNVSASPNQFGNYGVFSLSVDLTEEGMAHRAEITDMLMGYLELLREQGIDDRYAAEFRTSLDNRFRFLEKVNDFAYVSQLAAAMQDYPSRHAIDAPYRFEGFDAEAVNAVLAQLVPERFRVWYVSKDEKADETMHFYAGRYAIEPLTLSEPEAQREVAKTYALALPALNTLLPESFDVAHADAVPAKVVEKPGIEVWLQGSELYREQPKGFTQMYFNTASSAASAEARVLLALWRDLYTLEQTTLFTEASIAGMNAGVSADLGLEISVSGFTDKQGELIEQAVKALAIEPTEAELAQAVDRFVRNINNAKRGFPVRQLSPALRRVTRSGSFSDDAMLAAANAASVDSLKAFIDEQLSSALIRVYMFGNYGEADAKELVSTLESLLPERTTSEYVRADIYAPQPGQSIVYQEDLPVEDLGMMYLFAAPEASVEAIARGEVLAAHLSNRAFNQLRTEEQLGYAAGGFATELGDHPVIGFYIQTPVKNPVDMLARFDAYTVEFAEDVAALTEEDFERIKAGVITSLTKPAKNLAEEASPFARDWNRERYDFDSKAKLIAAVEQVTLADIQTHYQETVMTDNPSRILIQLRGRAYADDPYATIEGAQVITDIKAFHESMPVQAK